MLCRIIINHYSAKARVISLNTNSFIIQHINNKTKFEEKILSTSFLYLHSLVKMLQFTSIVGNTSCGPTYIESFFFTIFEQCINVLNYNTASTVWNLFLLTFLIKERKKSLKPSV